MAQGLAKLIGFDTVVILRKSAGVESRLLP
jgi:hypothetical protein